MRLTPVPHMRPYFRPLHLLAAFACLWILAGPLAAQAQLPDSLVKQAKKYINELDLADARTALDKALAQDPNHVEAHFQMGLVNYFSSKFYGALQSFNTVLKLDPTYIEAHIYRGDVLAMFNESDSAQLSYQRALHLDPKNSKAHMKMGVFYSARGETDDALEQFNTALSLNAKNEIAYYLRGNLYLKIGKRAEACADFQASANLGFTDAQEVYNTECVGPGTNKPGSEAGPAKPKPAPKPFDPKAPVHQAPPPAETPQNGDNTDPDNDKKGE